jgi:hypothetical protein
MAPQLKVSGEQFKAQNLLAWKSRRRTRIFTFLVGQSCRSALNSWAAQQRRPTDNLEIFEVRP